MARTLKLFRTLAVTDALNASRDSFLIFLVALPILVALIFRFLLPKLEETLLMRLDFDLAAYHPMLMGVFVGMAPMLIGSVYGLMLVDERDERTLASLRVMPVPFGSYLVCRMLPPVLLAVLITVCSYPLAGLTPLPLPTVTAVAISAASVVPVMALILINFAPSKVAGIALFRLVNALLALPAFAFIATAPWETVAWINPAYWPMKALWLANENQSFASELLIAVLINAPLTLWLYRRFDNRAET